MPSRVESVVCTLVAVTRLPVRSLFLLACSSAVLGLVMIPSQQAVAASSHRCASFVAARHAEGVYRATRVARQDTSVSCAQAEKMIKSVLGGPGAYKVTTSGPLTYYWKGGWRCSPNTGGTVGCTNFSRGGTIYALIKFRAE